jgi:hypothetical protein
MTKQTKYHTVETTLNIKTVKRGQIDTEILIAKILNYMYSKQEQEARTRKKY